MNKNTKGFTLIELLVVIAIIGILSAIVLSSLGAARVNANDSKVKGQLFSIRNAAELYYTAHFDYGTQTNATIASGLGQDPANGCGGGMFTDIQSGLINLSSAANYPSGSDSLVCNSNSTSYAVSDILSSGKYWCVDGTGKATEEDNPLTDSDYQCP